MDTFHKQIFVISDLHMGGEWPEENEQLGSRGFRMLTHTQELAVFIERLAAQKMPPVELVINGDIVDFLAEKTATSAGQEAFCTFRPDGDAVAKLLRERIAGRKGDREILHALSKLLNAGHELTLILGNHDVELSLPAVRKTLYEILGSSSENPRLRFLYDGEPYIVAGSALIEHGNLYDRFNRIDHGSLCQLRVVQSRRLASRRPPGVRIPPGSALVVDVMNGLKDRYPFVDLLKPETGAVVPLLLALAPELRWKIGEALWALRGLVRPLPESPDGPQPVALEGGDSQDSFALAALLAENLGSKEQAEHFMARLEHLVPAEQRQQWVAADASLMDTVTEAAKKVGQIAARVGNKVAELGVAFIADVTDAGPASQLALLQMSFTWDKVERRAMLLDALRCLHRDRSFSPGEETNREILEGVQSLVQGAASAGTPPLKYVIFGHTHLAKRVELPELGVTYLNSGTWVDLMTVPQEILRGTEAQALSALDRFIEALEKKDLRDYIVYRPTYVRIDLEAPGTIRDVGLYSYSAGPNDPRLQ